MNWPWICFQCRMIDRIVMISWNFIFDVIVCIFLFFQSFSFVKIQGKSYLFFPKWDKKYFLHQVFFKVIICTLNIFLKWNSFLKEVFKCLPWKLTNLICNCSSAEASRKCIIFSSIHFSRISFADLILQEVNELILISSMSATPDAASHNYLVRNEDI